MKSATSKQRDAIVKRARGYCEYCLSPMSYSPDPFEVEHIFPQSLGGKTELANLALSCHGCNNIKNNRISGHDPITDQMAPLYNPRKDDWKDHFEWSEDLGMILGLTPTGRVSVEMLQLNRGGVVNLRKLLLLVELHPATVLHAGLR